VKETLKVIKISDNIFFEMIIEKDNETDQTIDHLEDESIELRFEKSANQTDSIKKASFLYIVMKNIYLLILEIISDKDQRKFNENTIDTMLFFQIDSKINEILNSIQNESQSKLDSSIENESQSQSLSSRNEASSR
jgi:hypothetical protein